MVGVVARLVEVEGCDINQIDGTGSTPLAWASSNGGEGPVKKILGRDDVSLDEPNSEA